MALIACSATRQSPYAPVERETDAPQSRLFEAAEGALLENGFLIDRRDPEAGTLQTQQRTLLGDEVFRTEFRYAFKVGTRDGKLTVEMSCSQGDKSAPEPCGSERPEKLVKVQARLVEAILAEAESGGPTSEIESDGGGADAAAD